MRATGHGIPLPDHADCWERGDDEDEIHSVGGWPGGREPRDHGAGDGPGHRRPLRWGQFQDLFLPGCCPHGLHDSAIYQSTYVWYNSGVAPDPDSHTFMADLRVTGGAGPGP